MATTKKTDVTIAEQEDRVDIYIPRGNQNDDPNLFVSINGVNYLIPKGKTSSVPKAVAWEIERSRRAQEALDRKMEAMIEANK